MTALMNSTKRGFPTHENMQLFEDPNGFQQSPPIRNPIPPKNVVVSNEELTPQFLLKQNQKLAEVSAIPHTDSLKLITKTRRSL